MLLARSCSDAKDAATEVKVVVAIAVDVVAGCSDRVD